MYLSKIVLAVVSSAALFGGVLATTGDATWFNPGLGACGKTNHDSDLVVALNPGDFHNKASCGRRLRVKFQGKSVDVTTVDLCPGCPQGGVDLSPAAFKRLASLDVGRIRVDWNFI